MSPFVLLAAIGQRILELTRGCVYLTPYDSVSCRVFSVSFCPALLSNNISQQEAKI